MKYFDFFYAMYANTILYYEKNRYNNNLIININNIKLLNKLLFSLKYNYLIQLNMFIDSTAIDLYNDVKRFHVIINLLSIIYIFRILLKYTINEYISYSPSINLLFPMANWYEREIYELFGISFINNSDLRNLCLDYTMTGYPFRKDYPLSGYTELEYSLITRSLIIKPITLIQEYRIFKFELVWI